MAKAPTPRLIFVRHGQTEWSKSGQHTSVTDIPLTEFGVRQMLATGQQLIGDGPTNLVKPHSITKLISSPRVRAKQTIELLTRSLPLDVKAKFQVETNEDIREWEYGDYEGLLTLQIKDLRKQRGLNWEDWNIWEHGCENGEVAEDVVERLDRFIAYIKLAHKEAVEKDVASDIIVVAHGHILRCLAARWIDIPINKNPKFMLDAGGVGILSYQHHNLDEPALFLAGAFYVPVEETGGSL